METGKLILKSIWECKGPKAKTIMKKTQEVDKSPNNKMDYEATVLRQYGIGVRIEKRKKDQWDKIGNSQTDTHR